MGIIKRLWRHIFPCKHDWVQGREFYKEYEGKDYEFLGPSPMKYHPGYQANIYVCRKCHETYVAIEKIDNGEKIGGII